MADISTFPTITDGILHNSNANIGNYTAGETLKAGQVVGFESAGTTDTIFAMDASIGETPVGVVLYDTNNGDKTAVAENGALVTIANADDTTAIDAGDSVKENDNSVKGTVSPAAGAGGIPAAGDLWIIGQAKEDIAGSGTGKILVNIHHVPA